jgi:hypothetical protein
LIGLTSQKAGTRIAARARTRHPTEAPVAHPGETAISLAYDAGVSALEQQDATLANLRNRATNVFSTAALVAAIGGGLGLIHLVPADGSVLPAWAAVALLIILIIVGVLFVLIQWPVKNWSNGLHPRLILDRATESRDIERIKRELAIDLGQAMEENERRIRLGSRLLPAIGVLLVAEVVLFVVGMVSVS